MSTERDQETRKISIALKLLARIKPTDETLERLIAILSSQASWKSTRNLAKV